MFWDMMLCSLVEIYGRWRHYIPSEVPVIFSQTTCLLVPENGSFSSHCRENLKSHVCIYVVSEKKGPHFNTRVWPWRYYDNIQGWYHCRVCSVFSQPCLLFIKKCCLLLMYYPQSLADWTWQHCS
jgi:hypothetical protein